MLHHTTYVQRRLKLYRKNYTSYLVGVKSAVKPPATVGMAFHFDRLEKLLQNEENEEGYCLRRQRVLRDRLNPLDMYDDVDLYMRFRFCRTEIKRITDLLANDLRHDTDRNGALSPSLQVCLALRYFATGSFQSLVGDSIQVHKSTVCRTVRSVALSLCRRINTFVGFPSQPDQQIIARQKFFNIAGFPDVLGCVDGTHIRIKTPTEHENVFVNRKGYHSINAQIVCDADLKITNCVIKWPGSKHDSYILRQSRLWGEFEAGTYPGRLLGDSGYPLRPWLMTPYLNPANNHEERYNSAHIKNRNAVERCIGVLKKRWACLHRGNASHGHNLALTQAKPFL